MKTGQHNFIEKPLIPRIGHGYDVHRFKRGRKLILGGVEIEYELGLDGHSDADVVAHAVMDALLGAAGLGDIGKHFPDTDARYKGANSIKLLQEVVEMLSARNFVVGNIDVTIIAQQPKIKPFIETICKSLALALNTAVENVNVKATTEEGLGFTGAMEGISCHCVCLIHN